MKKESLYLNLVSRGQTIQEWEHDLIRESWMIQTGASDIHTVSDEVSELPTEGTNYRAVIYHGGIEIPSTNCISNPELFTNEIHNPLIRKGWNVKPHWEVLMLISQSLPKERMDTLGLAALILSLPNTSRALSLEYVHNKLTICDGYPHSIWQEYVGFIFLLP